MSAAIERMVAKCSIWLRHQRENQKEPLLPQKVPQRPKKKLGADIFDKDKTAGSVITSMKSMFARHGIPDQVVADIMPFSSKSFRQFARDWGFAVCTSSFSTHSLMG